MGEDSENLEREAAANRYQRQVKIAVYLYVVIEAIILMIIVYKILQTR